MMDVGRIRAIHLFDRMLHLIKVVAFGEYQALRVQSDSVVTFGVEAVEHVNLAITHSRVACVGTIEPAMMNGCVEVAESSGWLVPLLINIVL